MNPLEFAKQMELEGVDFFKNQLEKTNNPGLKRIIQFMVHQEENHFKVFDEMLKNRKSKIEDVPFLDEVKKFFASIKNTKDTLLIPENNIDFFEQGKEIEAKSEKFYRLQIQNVDDPDLKALFSEIADEERKHFLFMSDMVEYLRRPDTWVEHAEFTKSGYY